MKKNNQKGTSLLLTILIMTALLAIALGLARLSLGEIKLVRDIPDSLTAYYAAESGIEKAIYLDRKGEGTNLDECLDSQNTICYVVTITSGPPKKISSNGSFRDIRRNIEITY
jgi:hypothetical protein